MKYIFGLPLMVIFSIIYVLPANAQRNEFGLLLGGSYYLGDLNPSRHFAMAQVAGGAHFRRNFNDHFSLRVNGIYGNVQADDAIIRYNPERNLSFKSSIIELSTQAEVNFLPFIPGFQDSPYSFYLFVGAGAFRYNPKTEINGQLVELRPIGTEGQGSEIYPDNKVYSKYSYNFLFGAGMKFFVSKRFTAGIEWGMRRTGTDYLDDVSSTYPDQSSLSSDLAVMLSDRSENQIFSPGMKRGNPYVNDWYSFIGVIVSFKIKNPSTLICPVYD